MRHIVVCIECFGILSYVKMGLNGNIYMLTVLFGDMWDCCLHLTIRQTTIRYNEHQANYRFRLRIFAYVKSSNIF